MRYLSEQASCVGSEQWIRAPAARGWGVGVGMVLLHHVMPLQVSASLGSYC